MTRRAVVSTKRKIKEKRGLGYGAGYKPWTKAREFNSQGTSSNLIDWKTGRQVELFSQAELWWYYALRWDDNVIDIREQYPLDLHETVRLCEEEHIRHPRDKQTHMTTDLLVTKKNGLEAYSIKVSDREFDNERTEEKLFVEKLYWTKRGVPFHIVTKEDLDRQYILNLMDVLSCYDEKNVFDSFSKVRYLIAHKKLTVDLTKPIDYRKLITQI